MSIIKRIASIGLAVVCLVVGAVTLPLPTPIGLPLLVIGFTLLLSSSPGARRRFYRYRAARPKLDERIRKIEKYLPASMRRLLSGKRNRPERPGAPETSGQIDRGSAGQHPS